MRLIMSNNYWRKKIHKIIHTRLLFINFIIRLASHLNFGLILFVCVRRQKFENLCCHKHYVLERHLKIYVFINVIFSFSEQSNNNNIRKKIHIESYFHYHCLWSVMNKKKLVLYFFYCVLYPCTYSRFTSITNNIMNILLLILLHFLFIFAFMFETIPYNKSHESITTYM